MPTDTKKDLFEKTPIVQAVWTMALPTIFSQIIVLIYNMADTFYLGRTNDPLMVAGVSLILPVFNITLAIAALAGSGGGTLISRLLGSDELKEAQHVSSFSFYLACFVTATFSLILYLFLKPILYFLGASENTYLYAYQYVLLVVVIGALPTVLSNVMSNLLRSIGFSGPAGFGITMGGILNMILDPLFMFVLLPKGYEVLGVAIATLLSNCIACLYFFIVFYQKRNNSVLSLNPKLILPSKKSIGSVFNVGIPAALATFLFDIDYIVLDRLMSSYGDIALAAVGIVLKVERLPLNVGIGLCQGIVPLVAYNYASKDYKRMNGIIRFSLLAGLSFSLISVLLYEIFAPGLIAFFITETQTWALGVDFLRIRVLATPLMFSSFFVVYLFQGFGKGNRSLFLGVIRWAVFNIPMLFILNALIGMYGLVWAQTCGDILTVIISFIMYALFYKKNFAGKVA